MPTVASFYIDYADVSAIPYERFSAILMQSTPNIAISIISHYIASG
jgi:hypothetical protein